MTTVVEEQRTFRVNMQSITSGNRVKILYREWTLRRSKHGKKEISILLVQEEKEMKQIMINCCWYSRLTAG